MYASFGLLITFHKNNQVLTKNSCYGNSILAAYLGFSEMLFSTKLQQIFLKLEENMFLQPQIGI